MPIRDAKSTPSEERIAALRARYPAEQLIDATLTRKMRRRAGPAHQPQRIDDVVARLQRFLQQRIAGPFAISGVRSLAGGSSKEQFAFRLRRTDADGRDSDERLVLRMRPAESIVETHPLREYQALAAARGHLPVPPLYWIDPEGEEFGQPALIYGYCPGITKPPREGAYTSRAGFGRYRQQLAPQFVRHFATLARLDWSGCDMSAFDVPPTGSNAGVITAINGWQRVWEEDCVEDFPLMTLAAQWLRDNAPPIDHVSLVHQDFRGGNFLFDPADARITAILDWELVFLGDRHADLAFFLSPLFQERDETSGEALVGGLMPRAQFLEEYQRLSGLPVDERRLEYYGVFSCWRGAVNALATAPRVMMGEKTHQDIRVGWIIGTAPLVLARVLEALEGH